MDEEFEKWFKELYIRDGFVSSKVELYAAWRAAMVAEREACAKVAEIGICESDPGPYNNACRNIAATIRAR